VKHFRGRAPDQEALLDAFEKADWVDSLESSLLGNHLAGTKNKLRNTAKNLTRSLRGLLRFGLEGGSSRVVWQRG
jgi:hypothetical protein